MDLLEQLHKIRNENDLMDWDLQQVAMLCGNAKVINNHIEEIGHSQVLQEIILEMCNIILGAK